MRHNSGRELSTKPYRPFELLFVQEIDTYKSARQLEKYLKVKFNKEALLEIICQGGGMVYAQVSKTCEDQTS
jgi:predicted GIY-YIG superfamily endonuclease